MIEAIKIWWWRLGAERRLKRFRDGYGWAAGELLSERATTCSLTNRLFYHQTQSESERDPFDQGALQAIYDWKVRHQHAPRFGVKGEQR